MSRYIDAETLIADIDVMQDYGFNGHTFIDKFEVFDLIDGYDAADVQPVRRGEWILDKYYNWNCSNCKTSPYKGYITKVPDNYCPHCGAKMEGERNVR